MVLVQWLEREREREGLSGGYEMWVDILHGMRAMADIITLCPGIGGDILGS